MTAFTQLVLTLPMLGVVITIEIAYFWWSGFSNSWVPIAFFGFLAFVMMDAQTRLALRP